MFDFASDPELKGWDVVSGVEKGQVRGSVVAFSQFVHERISEHLAVRLSPLRSRHQAEVL